MPFKKCARPSLASSNMQRPRQDHVKLSDDSKDSSSPPHPELSRKKSDRTGSYIYAGFGKKPDFLVHLEKYVSTELQNLETSQEGSPELRLQVYRNVFGFFMKEFRTYRPLLSAIKKEYEDTITLQQEELQRLHQLTLRLQHETENHEQQVEARCADKETQIQGLRTERQQLRVQLTSMREREESLQAVVERLQSDLSSQYLKYREERDARQMLIRQLKHLTAPPVRVEPPADDSSEEPGDPAVLQLALRVCRNDLCEAQKELKRIKAERRSSDSVQQ